jgi:hypothetical protein
MRWYIGAGDRRVYGTDLIVGVIISPDITREEAEDIMNRGGWELVRPYWDYHHNEAYCLLTWEEVIENPRLQRSAIAGAERGEVWYRGTRRPFLVLFWDEVVRRVAVEPAALCELDQIAQRRGSFRRAKKIQELLKLLQEE